MLKIESIYQAAMVVIYYFLIVQYSNVMVNPDDSDFLFVLCAIMAFPVAFVIGSGIYKLSCRKLLFCSVVNVIMMLFFLGGIHSW